MALGWVLAEKENLPQSQMPLLNTANLLLHPKAEVGMYIIIKNEKTFLK